MKQKNPHLIMGIINITPDSFSDGGSFLDPEKAIKQCLKLNDQGADYLDLGAESTKPGSDKIEPKEEWGRLQPVLKMLEQPEIKKKIRAKISIDTQNDATMLKALNYDISMINNVHGLCEQNTLTELAKKPDLEYMAMHMHKSPKVMQDNPLKGSQICRYVDDFFSAAHKQLLSCGFSQERIWLDPGIGFGKTDGANLRLLEHSGEFAKQYNLAVGVSRKSWIGRTLNISDPILRDAPSKMMELSLWMAGAKLIRTHEVKTLAKLRNLLTRD